jgi:hypothetical protein
MKTRKTLIGKVLLVLGSVLVIFGALWVAIIFPGINRVPADLVFSTEQDGTVAVYDSDLMQPVSYDVVGTRGYEGVRSRGDTVYLRESCSFINTDTGEGLPFLDSEFLLAIDCNERANVPGHGDREREGYWSFPRDVKAGQEYPFWITANPEPLNAQYLREDEFRGLHVYVYEIQTPAEGITVPAGLFTPEMQLHQWILQMVEPVSGLTVYMESTTERTAMVPVLDEFFPTTGTTTYAEVTLYEDSLVFTDATVDKMVNDARFYHWALPWGSTHMPRLVFGLGILMLIVGPVLLSRKFSRVPAFDGLPGEIPTLASKP